mmetsp:Transcript_64589/g.162535  ORF Transcript_64589/g.162535 Transcript_64589/m.162535 type:complete len:282 (-) Transcript_64589:421-1266(-)
MMPPLQPSSWPCSVWASASFSEKDVTVTAVGRPAWMRSTASKSTVASDMDSNLSKISQASSEMVPSGLSKEVKLLCSSSVVEVVDTTLSRRPPAAPPLPLAKDRSLGTSRSNSFDTDFDFENEAGGVRWQHVDGLGSRMTVMGSAQTSMWPGASQAASYSCMVRRYWLQTRLVVNSSLRCSLCSQPTRSAMAMPSQQALTVSTELGPPCPCGDPAGALIAGVRDQEQGKKERASSPILLWTACTDQPRKRMRNAPTSTAALERPALSPGFVATVTRPWTAS